MDNQRKLNLDDLMPPWDRKVSHPMSEPEFHRILRRDENVAIAPLTEDFFGQGSALSQDIFSASVIRQSSIK